MDHTTAGLDFAVIGHLESWDKVSTMVNNMRRKDDIDPLPTETIREIFPYIPSRSVFDIVVHTPAGQSVKGIYIETFISPDEIDARHLQKNLAKVKAACACAVAAGARMVSLGGFTSIVLEAGGHALESNPSTFFTTGNTLTAALICEGIEKACGEKQVDLAESNLMIIGSTGDIGSACVHYFSGKSKQLLLCARNARQLQQQAANLSQNGIACTASVHVNELLPQADIIICVASSILEPWDMALLRPEVIICDAGYPKNIVQQVPEQTRHRIFSGGMGYVTAGFHFEPGYFEPFYRYPVEKVTHGCLLESIVLSMAKRYESYSVGRGNITTDKMKAILELSRSLGIEVAPFFNARERWQTNESKQTVL